MLGERVGLSGREGSRRSTSPAPIAACSARLLGDRAPGWRPPSPRGAARANRLKLELGWRGELRTKGLPVCPQVRLKGINTEQARERCGPSLVLPARLQRTHESRAASHLGACLHEGSADLLRDPSPGGCLPDGPGHDAAPLGGTWPHAANFKVDMRAVLCMKASAAAISTRSVRCCRSSPLGSSRSRGLPTSSPTVAM